jgi:ribosomal protein S17E
MKLTKIIIAFSAVIVSALLAVSCVKETGKEVALEQNNFTNKTFVQVYNATLNAARNYIYVDGSAVTGAAVAYGSTFPSTPSDFTVTSGIRAFLIRDTSSTILTQPPMSFAENFEANQNYTIFMYDTLTTPKHKTVKNDIVFPDDTTSRIRFANFIFSRNAVPNMDLFSVKRNANVFTNVQVTDVTNYIPHPSSSKTVENDTLYVRATGTTTNLATLTGFAPVRKRSYTLIFRGSYQAASPAKTLSSFSSN